MWEELAISIGKKAIEKFFDGINKQDNDLISIGLAVGYYYNFLDTISGVIDRGEFEIFETNAGGESQRFQPDEVRVQIIVPSRLDVHAFQRCEHEFNSLNKGFVYLNQNKRYYGINYSVAVLPTRKELTIVDLARPIMSAKRYYEDIVRLETYGDKNEKWLKIQKSEIVAFKESLRRLQERGYGGLVNKLDFLERG